MEDSNSRQTDWSHDPATIDELIVDAKSRGFPATKRLIYDWVEKGLLDHPERRTRGSGGSDKALWSSNQRNLFRILATLCNVPVGMWLLWGDEYVPVRQVQRALRTWAGNSVKVSWTTARRQAREIVNTLDASGGSPAQRDGLIEVLAKIGYSGPNPEFNRAELEAAVNDVFDPVVARDTVELIAARIRGLRAAKTVSEDDLIWAREVVYSTISRVVLEFSVTAYTFKPGVVTPALVPEDFMNTACPKLCLILGGSARQ